MKSERIVGIIGAGVIGTAVACVLAREGWQVLLIDRAAPGNAGASFGNAGHIAAELVEPLPSKALLFGFWTKLFALGGPMDLPLHRMPELLPWIRGFARASIHQAKNTAHLAPLVKPAVADMARLLTEIGRSELLRQNGHYEVWLGDKARHRAEAQARAMERLNIPTQPASARWLSEMQESLPNGRPGGKASPVAALQFTNTGHVVDPLEVVRALAQAAVQHGAQIKCAEVQALKVRPGSVELQTTQGTVPVHAAVVCAGAWSAPLLEPFGVRVPLQPVRGYHLELPGHTARWDAPILYSDSHVLVTPMQGRLRASSFMDFVSLDARLDPRKPARLLARLRALGYACGTVSSAWAGARPIFPDYLPGIGRIEGTNVLYAIGHHHLGLTLAPVTAQLIADLIAERTPRHAVSAFDLRRFGFPRI
jgi:glycine/D-amino acid oxidase-like deaminating enzyme